MPDHLADPDTSDMPRGASSSLAWGGSLWSGMREDSMQDLLQGSEFLGGENGEPCLSAFSLDGNRIGEHLPAHVRQGDLHEPPVGGVGIPCDQAARFERLEHAGDARSRGFSEVGDRLGTRSPTAHNMLMIRNPPT